MDSSTAIKSCSASWILAAPWSTPSSTSVESLSSESEGSGLSLGELFGTRGCECLGEWFGTRGSDFFIDDWSLDMVARDLLGGRMRRMFLWKCVNMLSGNGYCLFLPLMLLAKVEAELFVNNYPGTVVVEGSFTVTEGEGACSQKTQKKKRRTKVSMHSREE
jgi:hypothetical protein